MRRHRLAFLLPLLLLAAPAVQAQATLPAAPAEFEADLVDLAAYAQERTVLIFGLIGLGSGAVVSHDGKVVTNAHVVAGARFALVQWADGRSVLARRLGIDYGRDLAVLVPDQPLSEPVPAYPLANRRPAEGEWVLAAGFPGGLRTTPAPTISLGRVGGTTRQGNVMGMLDYSQSIRSDVPIFSGNSGGPMIDLQGRLLGINGAVDLEQAISMTIPIDAVKDRLERLAGGLVMLPGGQELDPRRNPLLERLYGALDPMLKELPQRVAEGSRQAAQAADPLRERLPAPAGGVTPSRDGLAQVARAKPRQQALDAACRAKTAPAFAGAGGVHLTLVDQRHAVAKASFLQGDELTVGSGVARVVARSAADDLALLRLPEACQGLAEDAPHRPVGSLVSVHGPEGPIASGIVSAEARGTSGSLIARIQQNQGPLEQVLRLIEGLGERLPLGPLEELVEQIRRAVETQKRFAGGTPPRSYRSVLSIDAPLPPSAAGAPVYDREGRLIGVSVGVAHHGTSYVVPMIRVREAFAGQLRAPRRPAQLGGARLY